MEIIFTKHALERLRERNVSVTKVITAIRKPEIKTVEKDNTNAAYKVFKDMALKVVYLEEDQIKVITVHWLDKRRLKKLKPVIEGEKL